MKSFIKVVLESIKAFWIDDYTYQASALSFITLLTIVPFFSILTFAITISGRYVWILKETNTFIYANFLPASGNIIQKYLQNFSTSASKLPFISIIFFIITVLMLIKTLEKTLNNIWNVKAYRSLFNRIISWSTMLIFPIFIAITTLANNFINIFFHNSFLNQSFLTVTVFLSHVFIFTMIYILVPNIRLKFINALVGGILVATLFHMLKFVFVFYVLYFTSFEVIYGSFSVIPVFLTWLYFSWSVFLYGAIFIHKRSQV